MKKVRGLKTIMTLVAAAALLTAGGTTEEAASPDAAPSGEQITLIDARGQEVVLDGPATRTVGLEWNAVENIMSLGVTSVGMADVEGYGNWVQTEPLTGEVTDVGVRGEPSVEAIAALTPDLVVATTDLPDAAVTQLETIAPVRSADAADPIGQMRANVELVAQATGKQTEAEALLADFDASLAAGAEAVTAAGLEGRPYAFSDAYIDGGQLSIRPFTEGSLAGAVAQEIGLVDAWTVEGDADYGLASTDVEGLTALGDVEYVYYDNAAVTPDPISETLTGNAVWESLPFVPQPARRAGAARRQRRGGGGGVSGDHAGPDGRDPGAGRGHLAGCAGGLRGGVRARGARRAGVRPAGADRRRRLLRHALAGHRDDRGDRPVQRDQGADLAVGVHLRPHVRPARPRPDRARRRRGAAGPGPGPGPRPRPRDLMACDDDTPQILGIALPRTRLTLLVVAALLTATAVAPVGVIAFVGLVAPHAARALVGPGTPGCCRSRCCSARCWCAWPICWGAA